jgi:hypothetical protein
MKQRILFLPFLGLLLFFVLHLSLAAFAPTTHAQLVRTNIDYGMTVYGAIENRFGDEWIFYGWEGDRVTITLTSREFDTYLELYGPAYRRWYRRNNNFAGMGTNSAIQRYRLPLTGYYAIVAATDSIREITGSYTLTLEGTTVTTFTENLDDGGSEKFP